MDTQDFIRKILPIEATQGAWGVDDVANVVDITMLGHLLKSGLIKKVEGGINPKFHTTEKISQMINIHFVDDEAEIPENLFDTIVGLDDVKKLIMMAIHAKEPVHIGLLGGPATAKSIILYELATKLPRSLYVDCSISTKTGIGEQLEIHRPKFLLLDEFDKMSHDDYNVLLNVMSSQKYVKTVGRGNRVNIPMRTWVIAVMNSLNIPKTIQERFLTIVKLKDYNRADAMKVMQAILAYDRNIDEDIASYIARKVVDELGTKNVRKAIQVANMLTKGTFEEVDEIIELVKRSEEGIGIESND